MSQSTFSQLQVSSSSTYCFKSTKMKHWPHPYTIQMPVLHETGSESSIADLTKELAGLMLAPSNNVQAVKRSQHKWSNYFQHQHWKQRDKQSFLQHQQQVSPMHQKVATVHTWKGHGLAPWGPIFSNIGPGPGPGGYPFWYPYHAGWPRLPIHSMEPSSPYPMFGFGGLHVHQSSAEPVIVDNQHERMQKANAMQDAIPTDEQNWALLMMDRNSTATSASQGYVPVASSENSQVPHSSAPSFVGRGFASAPQMSSQHERSSSSNFIDVIEDGGLQLPYTASTTVNDQCGRMQVAIQLTMPPTGREPSTPMKKNLIALQEGLQLPCTVSTAGTDQYDRMLVAFQQLTISSAAESLSVPMQQNCPLDPSTTFTTKNWTLEEVKEIESHIKTACSCPHGPHPSLQDLVVTGLEDHERSTPFLMTCLHGDLEAVKQIVDGWGINVCKANVHPLLGIPVEEVTPLFLAASKCHSNIVLYLVEKGANVSARTHSEVEEYSGLTPLHAAVRFGGNADNKISTIRCLLGHGADPSALPDDEEPVWLFDDTEDGQIITLLVHYGLNLSQRAYGDTPLHYWAGKFNIQHQNTSLNVVKMLVEKGGDLQALDDYDGFSVIMTAAKGGYGNLPNLPVLDFLLGRDEIPRMDKIVALELAGAVILGNDANHDKFPKAFNYWRQALTLGAEESDNLYKTPIKSENMQLSEWSTLADIMEIEQQPSLREIQSLFVQLRIYSGISSMVVYHHYMPYLVDFIEKGVDANRTLSQMIDISWATMEEIVRLHSIGCKLLAIWTGILIYKLASIVGELLDDNHDINSATLKTFVELVVMSDLFIFGLKSEGHSVDCCHHIVNLYRMFKMAMYEIMATDPEMITKDFEISLIQLLRRDCRGLFGFNVLHVICNYDLDYRTVSVVRLLLKLTADPNAADNLGNTSLHILAKELDEDPEVRDATARLLLDSGAHLDAGNKEGKTPAELWLDTRNQQGMNVGWSDLPDWLKGDCLQLKCLASRIIRRHKLPYNDGSILPVTLIPYVDLH